MMVNSVTVRDLLFIPVKPFSYLWFLWVLAFLFLTVPYLIRLCSRRILLVGVFFCGYVLPWQGMVDVSMVRSGFSPFFYGGFYFVLGSYLRMKHFESAGMEIRRWMLPFSALICTGNCAAHLYFGKDIWPYSFHEAIVALAACYLIWYVFAAYWDKKEWIGTQFFRLCGEKSLEIYLLHMYFIGPCRIIFHKIGLESVWIGIAVSTALAVLVPLAVGLLADRWKWVHDIFHPADWLRERGMLPG